MPSNLDHYKKELDDLVKLGEAMSVDLQFRYLENQRKLSKEEREKAKGFANAFERHYQRWYSEALAVVKQLAPDRSIEFENLYKGEGKRHEINVVTYTIQDWLNGVRAAVNEYTGKKPYDDFGAVTMRFSTQLGILRATTRRFESKFFDIKQLVPADLNSELDAARELVKHGFLRGAGAIAGVVLEKHLAQVASNHNITIRKQHPAISDLNDALKNGNVIETPVWRGIQRLGDLQNICDHNKSREPSTEDVSELIDGVEKYTKTLF